MKIDKKLSFDKSREFSIVLQFRTVADVKTASKITEQRIKKIYNFEIIKLFQIMDNLIFTESYFEKILQKNLKSLIKIENLQISPCNATGEGFLSSLLRISIDYQDLTTKSVQKVSLITKSECTNEFSLEKVGKNGFDVQNKEIKFFQEIAPKILEVLNSKSNKILPDLIAIDEENQILIFEDLQQSNYKMADRVNGMDKNHVIMCLKKFAEFHAASLKVQEMNLEVFGDFQTGMFSRNADKFDFAIVNLFQFALEEISTWKGFEGYAEKMKNVKKNVLENIKKSFDVNSNELNVLNHGDLWTTNLMFQYDEESDIPKNLVLVSF